MLHWEHPSSTPKSYTFSFSEIWTTSKLQTTDKKNKPLNNCKLYKITSEIQIIGKIVVMFRQCCQVAPRKLVDFAPSWVSSERQYLASII